MNAPTPPTPLLAHARWPATRFYWAVLDTTSLPTHNRGMPPRLSLESCLADFLPIDPSLVHAVFISLPNNTILACAALITDLDTLPHSTRTLAPSELPPVLANTVPPDILANINLLHGLFEPACVRRARHTLFATTLYAAAAIITLVATGLHIRAADDRRAALAALNDADRIATDTLMSPSAAPLTQFAPVSSARPRTALSDAVTSLSRDRGDIARNARPPDAALAMSTVLQGWPRQVETRIDSIAFNDKSIRLSGTVESFDDASTLADSLKAVPGWIAEQPQVAAQGQRVSLRASLTRAPTVSPSVASSSEPDGVTP